MSSPYTSRKEAVTVYLQEGAGPSGSETLESVLNRSVMKRGIKPVAVMADETSDSSDWCWEDSEPIVKVFPEPVWPYARICGMEEREWRGEHSGGEGVRGVMRTGGDNRWWEQVMRTCVLRTFGRGGRYSAAGRKVTVEASTPLTVALYPSKTPSSIPLAPTPLYISFCVTRQSKTMSYLNDLVPMLIERSLWCTDTTLADKDDCSRGVRGRTRTPTRTLQLLLLPPPPLGAAEEVVEGRLVGDVENN